MSEGSRKYPPAAQSPGAGHDRLVSTAVDDRAAMPGTAIGVPQPPPSVLADMDLVAALLAVPAATDPAPKAIAQHATAPASKLDNLREARISPPPNSSWAESIARGAEGSFGVIELIGFTFRSRNPGRAGPGFSTGSRP